MHPIWCENSLEDTVNSKGCQEDLRILGR